VHGARCPYLIFQRGSCISTHSMLHTPSKEPPPLPARQSAAQHLSLPRPRYPLQSADFNNEPSIQQLERNGGGVGESVASNMSQATTAFRPASRRLLTCAIQHCCVLSLREGLAVSARGKAKAEKYNEARVRLTLYRFDTWEAIDMPHVSNGIFAK